MNCFRLQILKEKKFLLFFVINVTSVASITNVFTVYTVTTVANVTTVTTLTSVGRSSHFFHNVYPPTHNYTSRGALGS